MASNYTENYGLCQWEATDQVLREEFNEGNRKVDEALKGLAEKNAALETFMSQCGNCQVYITNYTGTGTYGEDHPCVLTFPFKPALVMVIGHYGMGFTTAGSPSFITMNGREGNSCIATWTEDKKTVSWFITNNELYQMNSSDWLYQVTALGEPL